jgi:hypothetical protein
VRSARPLQLAAVAATALAVTGCTTTQQVNRRYTLRATRTLASRHPLVVTRANPDVDVKGVWLLRGHHHGTAVVVALANRSGRTLTDLPISVGAGAGARRHYLNRRANLDYFQTHVASIAPRAGVRWVFTTARRVPASARPFAVVGAPRTPPVSTAGSSLPDIRAAAAAPPAAGAAARSVRVRLDSRSPVPQYGLPVYVLAHRGARLVGAGRLTLAHLGTAGRATVAVPLVGGARGASLAVQALPSIFH